MKTRIFAFIIAALVILSLASCAGIGDGALIDNVQTSGEMLGVIEDQNADELTILTVYDTDGNGLYRVKLGDEHVQELTELIKAGEYDSYRDDASLGNKYILVDFPSEINLDSNIASQNDFKIYADDFVAEMNLASSWMPGLLPLGKQEGIYERVIEIMNEASKDIVRAESAAGFAFDTLIVCTKQGYGAKISDFEDLGCIGVNHLMEDKQNNNTWWTLTFDSFTEDEIRDIATKLKSREGIVSVEFNYILTLD